jgi:hypothetical protein
MSRAINTSLNEFPSENYSSLKFKRNMYIDAYIAEGN